MELVFHHSHSIDNNNNNNELQRSYLQAVYDLPYEGEYFVNIEVSYLHFNPHDVASSPVFCLDNEILTNYSMKVVKDTSSLLPTLNECTSDTLHMGGHHGLWMLNT